MSRKVSGFQAWVVQRLSAIYLALGFIFLAYHFAFCGPADYMEWKAWLSHPAVYTGLSLFFLSLLMHAWIGVRDVVIDYVHPLGIRLIVLSGIALVLIASGFWLIRALIMVAV